MSQDKRLSRFLLISPLIVLILTRLGVELSKDIFEREFSWITGFLSYYLSILIVYLIVLIRFNINLFRELDFSFHPVPKFGFLFWTIVIPALLPVAALISQFDFIPAIFFLYILIFAIINSVIEEVYWRGFLYKVAVSKTVRILLSAGLFSFSHYLFWGYWYRTPIIMIPTLVSTFIMGLLWMHFMNREKKIIYPILSHLVVDILNCSVAVYFGLIHPAHF